MFDMIRTLLGVESPFTEIFQSPLGHDPGQLAVGDPA